MASNTTGQGPTQAELAQKRLFDDSDFAQRYKVGEILTGSYGLDILNQFDLASYTAPIHFLDLACGTGIVSKHAVDILSKARPTNGPLPDVHFTCADLAPAMLDVLKARIQAESWPLSESQVSVVHTNMLETNLPSETFTHLGCNFGPCLAPTPEKTLAECYRLLRPGGVAGWTAWVNVGWLADMKRAFGEIRTAAADSIARGTATQDDQKLSKLPEIMPPEILIGRFAGVDIPKLRAEGVAEEDIPRWDREDFFRSQVERVGFTDVKIMIQAKTIDIDQGAASQMVKPIIDILMTIWTEDEQRAIEGADLQGKVAEWWARRCQEDDVVNGKVTWTGFWAMVITARKAA